MVLGLSPVGPSRPLSVGEQLHPKVRGLWGLPEVPARWQAPAVGPRLLERKAFLYGLSEGNHWALEHLCRRVREGHPHLGVLEACDIGRPLRLLGAPSHLYKRRWVSVQSTSRADTVV